MASIAAVAGSATAAGFDVVVVELTERVSVTHPPSHRAEHSRHVRWSIASGFAREDLGDSLSSVFDRQRGRLLVLDHDARTWQEYPLPVRIEDHLPSEAASAFAAHAPTLDGIRPHPARDEVMGDRTATRFAWSVEVGETDIEVAWWTTSIEGTDEEAYWQLARGIAALHPVHRLWMGAVDLPAGIPLRQSIEIHHPRRSERRERLFESARQERGVAPDLFAVPPGYRRKPAGCLRDVAFGDALACR